MTCECWENCVFFPLFATFGSVLNAHVSSLLFTFVNFLDKHFFNFKSVMSMAEVGACE